MPPRTPCLTVRAGRDHDHRDFLFMEIKQLISCKSSVIMSQAAEFPRDVPDRAAGHWAKRANGTANTRRDRR
jgi:hypothetical protein